MTDNHTAQDITPTAARGQHDSAGSAAKDPDDWVTGEEPATASQRSYVETLATDSGTEVPDQLTKAEASKLIDELQDESPRLD